MNPIILSLRNSHERDEHIVFQEEGHKYTILTDVNSKYTSVTTWIHSHFPQFNADKIITRMMSGKNWNPQNKYWGMTASEIKKMWADNGAAVAGAGTNMHFRIECFMNHPLSIDGDTHEDLLRLYLSDLEEGDADKRKEEEEEDKEWCYFLKFVDDFPHLKPYRTEWLVYNEDWKLSGSIDMVYENEDGTLSIYDWKRSKEIGRVNNFNEYSCTDSICHLPNTNFWHYSLQLNTYKSILEEKYDKKIKDLYLVRLHPNNEDETYELIDVPILQKEMSDLTKSLKQKQI